ncbi:MAG: uridylate kinase [Synergistaceae bacterium]|jgi:acetylglutamate/LysW-gamma-L-alpha-aminoadipate kinase|nr:uridylate kinase [Synergistaceae bacterium]
MAIVKIGVVKIGGAEGNRLEPLASELAARVASGEKWVVVHGASGVMDKLCRERGVEIRMITSPSGYRSRFVGETERALFEEAALAYGASVKRALEVSGAHGEQLTPQASGVRAKRKDVVRENAGGRVRIVRGNYSGTVEGVDANAILAAMEGAIPIMPPLGYDRESGLGINIDGDRLAAAVSAALPADVMIILSNVPGLMKDVNDPESRIKTGSLKNWDALEHYAQGNMKRKLLACGEALEGGVRSVYLADGRVENPIGRALGGDATCLVR